MGRINVGGGGKPRTEITTQKFETPGTYNWTVPKGVTRVTVLITSGGSGSSRTIYLEPQSIGNQHNSPPNYCIGHPGEARGAILFRNVTPGQTIPITVGSGGAGWGAGTIASFSDYPNIVTRGPQPNTASCNSSFGSTTMKVNQYVNLEEQDIKVTKNRIFGSVYNVSAGAIQKLRGWSMLSSAGLPGYCPLFIHNKSLWNSYAHIASQVYNYYREYYDTFTNCGVPTITAPGVGGFCPISQKNYNTSFDNGLSGTNGAVHIIY